MEKLRAKHTSKSASNRRVPRYWSPYNCGNCWLCPHCMSLILNWLDKVDFAKVAFASALVDAESMLKLNLKLVHPDLNQTRIEVTADVCHGTNIITTWFCVTSNPATCWPFCTCVELILGWVLCPHCIVSSVLQSQTCQTHLQNRSWQNQF